MDLDAVQARLAAARPRVAAELARPHAEEALLAGVVTDLAAAGRLDLTGGAFGVPGKVERVLLWGADAVTGAEDLGLAGALRALAPDAGRAVLLDAEPDLVVVTSSTIAAVDAAVERPGHAAARAARGEPMPEARIADLQQVLARHAVDLDAATLALAFAPARLTAVALELAAAAGKAAAALALAGRAGDLLHPERDGQAAWSDAAIPVAAAAPDVAIRVVSWLQVAEVLAAHPDAAAAVRRIRTFPPLAAARS